MVGRMQASEIRDSLMDKGAIFSDLTRRNALRKAKGLPTFDLHAEFRHEVGVAAEREFQTLCARHADEREIVRTEVVASRDVAAMTMAERWEMGREVTRLFEARVALRYGARLPETVARHPVIYGEKSLSNLAAVGTNPDQVSE
jgi:hypothetical protein